MDKKTALKTLLKHSFFLTEKAKADILNKLDVMSETEIETIARFLILEKDKSLTNASLVSKAAEELLGNR